MPNFNSVQLMGHLCRDWEIRHTQSGTAIGNNTIAVSRKWKSKDGQTNEDTAFIDLDAWAKSAEMLDQYTSKGDALFVVGRIRQDQWQDSDGNNRSKLKVVVESFQFLGGKRDGGQRQQSQQRNTGRDDRPAPDDSSIPF